MAEEREKEIAVRGDEWASSRTADRGGYYFAGLSEGYYNGYIAGATENSIQWHKITDWKNQEQFPDDVCKGYLVYINLKYLKIKQYVVCNLDITEGFRQFYLDDGDDDIDPEDVIAWCEIPQFKE